MRTRRNFFLLLADTKFFDQGTILVDILGLQIIQKAAALTNQLEQSPAGMMILLVVLKMAGQVCDAIR